MMNSGAAAVICFYPLKRIAVDFVLRSGAGALSHATHFLQLCT